jgi:hypothetical protein
MGHIVVPSSNLIGKLSAEVIEDVGFVHLVLLLEGCRQEEDARLESQGLRYLITFHGKE